MWTFVVDRYEMSTFVPDPEVDKNFWEKKRPRGAVELYF